MKKTILALILSLSLVTLSACGNQEQPLTEKQQAEKYNMTMEEYQEMKEAAARMNMSIEEHMKMLGDEDHEHDMMEDDDHGHDDMEMKDE